MSDEYGEGVFRRFWEWLTSTQSWADDALEGKVIIPEEAWDGFPENADECRRSYNLDESVNKSNLLNISCQCCGDPILSHDTDGGTWRFDYERE